MPKFSQMATRIIKEQELVIGPLAWHEASKVAGLQINNEKTGEVAISGHDPKVVIDALVSQYVRLFGRASHEVCREAVISIIVEMPLFDVPTSLRA